MYEQITYELLLKQMLAYAVSKAQEKGQQLDTREGSMLWYGQAPAAVEAQNLYIQLDTILNETFADTASREYLILRAKERGLSPKAATHSICRAEFTPAALEIPQGTRFSLNALNYTVIEKITNGEYKIQCETAGEIGNEYIGQLIPIEYIDGLQTAYLTEVLIPGEDEQDTESFRSDYLESFDSQAFGGNIADYKRKVNTLNGIGGVKIYREWNGGIKPSTFTPPADFASWYEALEASTQIKAWLQNIAVAAQDGLLTVGGAIRLIIIDSTYARPSDELIANVQTLIDPETNHGEGLGIAPIGHYVTVRGVENIVVNISTKITYQEGWSWKAAQAYIETAIDDYFTELAKTWENDEFGLIIRISGIETRILSCPGVLDITDTSINGESQNLSLNPDSIPIRGEIIGT